MFDALCIFESTKTLCKRVQSGRFNMIQLSGRMCTHQTITCIGDHLMHPPSWLPSQSAAKVLDLCAVTVSWEAQSSLGELSLPGSFWVTGACMMFDHVRP